jgi:hypothetical protein
MTALSTLLGAPRFIGRGFIDGLITANAADADHDITVGAGECRDSANVYHMMLASAITKQIDAAWAAGSAAGGLFSGSVANATWYHVFLIRKDADGTIDAGFDTSVTAANRPAGYTAYRRIGSVLTDGSANILGFVQTGDRWLWKTSREDVWGGTLNSTESLTVLSVPTGISVHPMIGFTAYKPAIDPTYLVSSPETTNNAVARFNYSTYVTAVGNVAQSEVYGDSFLKTDTSGRIRFRSNTDGCTYWVQTWGLDRSSWKRCSINPCGKDERS